MCNLIELPCMLRLCTGFTDDGPAGISSPRTQPIAASSVSSSGASESLAGSSHSLLFASTAKALVGTADPPVVMGGFDIASRAFAARLPATPPETFNIPLHVHCVAGAARYYCPHAEFTKILSLIQAATLDRVGPAVSAFTAPVSATSARPTLPVVRIVVTSEASMHRTVSALAVMHQTHLDELHGNHIFWASFAVYVFVFSYVCAYVCLYECMCACMRMFSYVRIDCVSQLWIFACMLFQQATQVSVHILR